MLLHRLHRSIPPSERMEKTRSGYVIPHMQGEERTVEKRNSGEGGVSLHSTVYYRHT